MAYFPFFIDLEDREGLIVGGGTVALRKVHKLLPYGPRLTVAAPELLPELEAIQGLTFARETFAPAMLDGKFFVIAATNDPKVNHAVAALCRERGILVNVVDDKACCGFLFPALVKHGDLSIGISTGGVSPSAAVWMKRQIAGLVPEDFNALLEYLAPLRPVVRERVPDASKHGAAFSRLFHACIETGFPLSEQTLAGILEGASKSGKVYLVGAGCGGADLITVRGLRLLERCDAIVYDDLLSTDLLEAVPERGERIYAGKRQGRHSMTQSEINALLIEKAREGKIVVRLKGGDPYVFGRGGEEALALESAGIAWEYVPGVTSAVAVPGAAGIPVTHRGVSQSVHIVTAHTAETSGGLPLCLESLARFPKATLVFLMGLSRLEALSRRLLQAGLPPETPAAVIGNQVIRGTLADIAAKTRTSRLEAPAVTVIGETAGMNLREK